MSLILQGIDLPKDGKTITVDIDSNGVAWVSNKGEWDKHQAIQIPKGHGRLIDEKEILSPVLCRPKSLRLNSSAQYNIVTLIDEAPTILEEELSDGTYIKR